MKFILKIGFVLVFFIMMLQADNFSIYRIYLKSWAQKPKIVMRFNTHIVDHFARKIVCKNGRSGILIIDFNIPNITRYSVRDLSGRLMTGKYMDGNGGGINYAIRSALHEYCK